MSLATSKLGSQGWAVDSAAAVLTPPSCSPDLQQQHAGVSSSSTLQSKPGTISGEAEHAQRPME